jgi:hypothetical protein
MSEPARYSGWFFNLFKKRGTAAVPAAAPLTPQALPRLYTQGPHKVCTLQITPIFQKSLIKPNFLILLKEMPKTKRTYSV